MCAATDRTIADCHHLSTETPLVANSTKFLFHTTTFLVSRRFPHFLNWRKHFETLHNLVSAELTSSNSGTWSYCLVLAGGGDVAEADRECREGNVGIT
jgi:hypothetical protein